MIFPPHLWGGSRDFELAKRLAELRSAVCKTSIIKGGGKVNISMIRPSAHGASSKTFFFLTPSNPCHLEWYDIS